MQWFILSTVDFMQALSVKHLGVIRNIASSVLDRKLLLGGMCFHNASHLWTSIFLKTLNRNSTPFFQTLTEETRWEVSHLPSCCNGWWFCLWQWTWYYFSFLLFCFSFMWLSSISLKQGIQFKLIIQTESHFFNLNEQLYLRVILKVTL